MKRIKECIKRDVWILGDVGEATVASTRKWEGSELKFLSFY